jgi:squalene synthase HpnC
MSGLSTNSSVPAQPLGWNALPESYRIPEAPPSLEEAQVYCANLAKTHYENFSVASWFLPARLRQHFYNVYAYCRISDDLGDEVGNAQQSLELLDQWEAELNACYEGSPRHPVFVALAGTVKQFGIPKHEFSDLLIAFRQDQTVTRFETFDDLLGYCRYSANPVGHLVLYLCGYNDAGRQQLSDYTCTALQLANFWQDIPVDLAKGRVYLPLEAMERHGYTVEDLEARRETPQFRALMREAVDLARKLFLEGLPLVRRVDRRLGVDISLFSRGGLRVLDKIEGQNYNVLARRPYVTKVERAWLLAGALARMAFGRAA